MITNQELKALNDKGIFRMADAMPTFTPNNMGMPAGILSSLSPKAVENILAKRTADEVLGGRQMLLSWAKQDAYVPFIEKTGQTQPYGDYSMPASSNANINFNSFNHYRFSASVKIGELMAEQMSEAKINANDVFLRAATEALAVELNNVAFNGYVSNSSNKFLVYGLLNNPSLSAYENASQTFANSTWQQIMAFFSGAIVALIKQSGNNINPQSRIRCAISASAYGTLTGVFTDLGISVLETLQKTYPNMEFIPAIELDSANANQNVVYFIGENELGGISETSTLGYSELARMSNVAVYESYTSQKMSCGTIGAVIYKPSYIVRYTNI